MGSFIQGSFRGACDASPDDLKAAQQELKGLKARGHGATPRATELRKKIAHLKLIVGKAYDAGGQWSRTSLSTFSKMAGEHRRDKANEAAGRKFRVWGLLKSGAKASKPTTHANGNPWFTKEEADHFKTSLESMNPGRKWVVEEG